MTATKYDFPVVLFIMLQYNVILINLLGFTALIRVAYSQWLWIFCTLWLSSKSYPLTSASKKPSEFIHQVLNHPRMVLSRWRCHSITSPSRGRSRSTKAWCWRSRLPCFWALRYGNMSIGRIWQIFTMTGTWKWFFIHARWSCCNRWNNSYPLLCFCSANLLSNRMIHILLCSIINMSLSSFDKISARLRITGTIPQITLCIFPYMEARIIQTSPRWRSFRIWTWKFLTSRANNWLSFSWMLQWGVPFKTVFFFLVIVQFLHHGVLKLQLLLCLVTWTLLFLKDTIKYRVTILYLCGQLCLVPYWRAESITDLNAFQIAFCCFSSNSPEFLYVTLNCFRKHCSNVLSMQVCPSFCNKNGNLAIIIGFIANETQSSG